MNLMVVEAVSCPYAGCLVLVDACRKCPNKNEVHSHLVDCGYLEEKLSLEPSKRVEPKSRW
jgi:hypothetical protein